MNKKEKRIIKCYQSTIDNILDIADGFPTLETIDEVEEVLNIFEKIASINSTCINFSKYSVVSNYVLELSKTIIKEKKVTIKIKNLITCYNICCENCGKKHIKDYLVLKTVLNELYKLFSYEALKIKIENGEIEIKKDY